MAAVLHDVVEDTPITLEKLTALGYPAEVAERLARYRAAYARITTLAGY